MPEIKYITCTLARCVPFLDKGLVLARHGCEASNFYYLASSLKHQFTVFTALFSLRPIPKIEGFCMIHIVIFNVCSLSRMSHLCSCDHTAFLLVRHSGRLKALLFSELGWHSSMASRCHALWTRTTLHWTENHKRLNTEVTWHWEDFQVVQSPTCSTPEAVKVKPEELQINRFLEEEGFEDGGRSSSM